MPGQFPKKIGKYEVIQQLGEGGMGAVYKAVDPYLQRTVAIKVLKSDLSSDHDLQDRFYREARATALLRHPNIVAIYDMGGEDNFFYQVMEFVEGSTLDRLIQENRPLSLPQKLNIIIEVCQGLAHAHRNAIVHRDIKPSNIMVSNDGTVRIVDFGIARLADDSHTRTGQFLGTMAYISPEQLNAEPIDGRSDIFCTGIVLYKLLTLHLPFESDSLENMVLKILRNSPTPLGTYLAEYPPELEAILNKALAKSKHERYRDALELAGDLYQLSQKPDLPYALKPDLIPAIKEAPTGPNAQILPWQDSPAPIQDDSPIQGGATIIEGPLPTRILAGDARAGEEPAAPGHPPASEFTMLFGGAIQPPQDLNRPPIVRLTFISSSDGFLVGKSVEIGSLPFRIGRAAPAELTIADVHLSRLHATIDWKDKAFVIADAGSGNGTYVNGRRVRGDGELLQFGAVIRLGNTTVLSFSSDEISELPDLTGQTIGGRYRLIKLLRNGSKTALYQAIDAHLPREVAVKILSPSLAEFPGYLEAFRREAENAARLHHPHICRVIDHSQGPLRIAGRSMSINHLVMELMEGGNMAARLADGPSFDLPQTISWLDDITDALEYAHRRDVVHGGLKLSSIVFDGEGEVYVTDFATAIRVEDKAKTVFTGSPEFVAPEVWDGEPPSPLSDQYSLAVITYTLLTGGFPYEGQLDPKVRERNFRRGPIPAHEEAAVSGRPPVPPRCSEVLKRALEVKPEARYPSMREYFLALKYATQPSRGGDKPTIFISYQRGPSSAWALHIGNQLEQKYGIYPFVDTQRMDTVARFPLKLKKAIEDCDVFVCLLSGTTLDSNWVQEEIRIACESNKPMIPVFQESYRDPESFQSLAPHIKTLINYNGIKLLDEQNVYVKDAISQLGEMIIALRSDSLEN
jgi:serine/threonine protein kinase